MKALGSQLANLSEVAKVARMDEQDHDWEQ